MAKKTVINTTERAKELKPLRELMHQEWLKNKEVRPTELARQFGVVERTAFSWVYRWRKEGERPYYKPERPLSWEDIVEAAPDTIILSSLLFDGFMSRLEEQAKEIERLKTETSTIPKLKEEIKAITGDRIQIFQQYNELLSKVKSGGHFTIDTTQKILIPKEER